MVSYIKTQWFRLLVAIFCFVMTCIYVFKPSPDTTTVEGLNTLIAYMVNASLYFTSFIIWAYLSFIDYNSKRIELLEEKQERDDAMYNLVQELVAANKIDRELDKARDEKIKKLEEKLR